MGITTDRDHPDLTRGADESPVAQSDTYLVLSAEEIDKGFVQPYFNSYVHKTCGTTTTMGKTIAKTYARDPWFYGGTYCVQCAMHRELSEFVWPDGRDMSPHLWSDEQLESAMARKKELDDG